MKTLMTLGALVRAHDAGLACPDWPLCFGSFLPGRQMNVQVFLEWFHRLDAFGLQLQFSGNRYLFQRELKK